MSSFLVPQLARGVTLQAEEGVLPVHPAPVVAHLHEGHPAPLDLDPDLARPGIQAVLHQLLHHARGRSTTSPAATWLARASDMT